MWRSTLLSLVAALALAPAGSAQNAPTKNALGKAWLEIYARHLWVLGPDLDVKISDPTPSSDLPGFQEVTVHLSKGDTSQDVTLLISADGSKIIEGNVYASGANPYKKNLDKLKTQLQPSLGTPGAPVVVVEFSDMQCPHCKEEAKTIRENLIQAYPKEVRLYFKDFPLTSIHDWAKPAAMAGRCVFRQSASSFWDYHDWIFAQQDAITAANLPAKVVEWAKTRQDVDAQQLNRCIDGKATEKEVDASAAEAVALQVDGTPTLFVNGRRLPSGIDWAHLKLVIDAELEYQKIAKDAGEDCGCETKLDAPGLPPKASPIAPALKKK